MGLLIQRRFIMQVTRNQIIAGAANFIRSEVIPHVPDKSFRAILEAGSAMVEMAPQMADRYFNHPVIAAMLREQDGNYDLDFAEAAVVKAMEAHGNLTLTVPGIKWISPETKTLTFSPNDVRTLKRYITG